MRCPRYSARDEDPDRHDGERDAQDEGVVVPRRGDDEVQEQKDGCRYGRKAEVASVAAGFLLLFFSHGSKVSQPHRNAAVVGHRGHLGRRKAAAGLQGVPEVPSERLLNMRMKQLRCPRNLLL